MSARDASNKPTIDNDLSFSISSDEDNQSVVNEKHKSSEDASSIHFTIPENTFEANENNIMDSALYLYDYLNKVIGIEEENIILFGRSIGTGPATYVASKRKPGAVLLMSAFKSIRDIVKD